jgi:hypothetical protein
MPSIDGQKRGDKATSFIAYKTWIVIVPQLGSSNAFVWQENAET